MADWWSGRSDERYWCEITDRHDVGANLWCPQADRSGRPQWSYSLINQVAQGDIVFHYSTPEEAFVGASVACGVLEDCELVWVPHGTAGRDDGSTPRPGWRLPLTGFRRANPALPKSALEAPAERRWLEDWVETNRQGDDPMKIPVQFYRADELRANQGYLTKMPRDFVERWEPLRTLAEHLSRLQDDLTLDDTGRFAGPSRNDAFNPRSSEPYSVVIEASQRIQSRNHERLVAKLGAVLRPNGATLFTTRHPIDVFMEQPTKIIIEAKAVGSRHAGHAVREAVGQLLEYRHFVGPHDAKLCIALDAEPSVDIVSYVENVLEMFIVWVEDDVVYGGARTVAGLGSLGVVTRGLRSEG